MPEQVNQDEFSQLRKLISGCDDLADCIVEKPHSVSDPDRDETYEIGGTYRDVASMARYIDGRDIHYGIRLRLETELTSEIESILESHFETVGYDFSEFTISERELWDQFEYRIENESILDDY